MTIVIGNPKLSKAHRHFDRVFRAKEFHGGRGASDVEVRLACAGTFDHLAQPHRHIVVKDGRARLTYYGRGALESLRQRGARPRRYPLAQLHMIELAIGCSVASRVAVAKWRQALAA